MKFNCASQGITRITRIQWSDNCEVDFHKDYFKSVIEKMNAHCKGYYINELLSKANSE